MREIKFRAWDKQESEYMPSFMGGRINLNMFGAQENERFVLLQYTGLKDKNGVEIYEGDIVSNDLNMNTNTGKQRVRPVVTVIEWGNKTFDDFGNGSIGWEIPYYSDFKIVGNIYENPELLKEPNS